MIFNREKCTLPQDIPSNYGNVKIYNYKISDDSIEYINNFYDYAKEKNADVVISFPPILDERFYGTEEDIKNYENNLKENLKPQVISNVTDYIFPRKYMFDTIYHCNNEGEKISSERLANDINNYLKNKGIR